LDSLVLDRGGRLGAANGLRDKAGSGGAGVAEAPAIRASLVGSGANVDARSCLRVVARLGVSSSPSSWTPSLEQAGATDEEAGRGEDSRVAQPTRSPSEASEHGGDTHKQGRSTLLGGDRPPRPSPSSSTQASPSSQEAGDAQASLSAARIVRTDPLSDSLLMVEGMRTRSVATDSKASGGKSGPWRRRGRGGHGGQVDHSKVAPRGSPVGEGHTHLGACVRKAAGHLILHGHTTARPLVNDCATGGASPGLLGRRSLRARSTRAREVLWGPKVRLRLASPRRGTPLPPTTPCSEHAGGGPDQRGDFLGRLLDQSDTPKTISTTTRDTDTGPFPTSRTIKN